MLFTVPAWAVAAGLGVAGIAERVPRLRLPRFAPAWRPGYAAVAIALVVVVAAFGVHDQLAIRKPLAHNLWAFPVMMVNGEPVDYRAAAAVIAANQRPGDGIAYQVKDANHYEVDTAIAYYLRGRPMPKTVFQAETPAQADALQPVECVDPSSCLTGTPRIWVVYIDRLAHNPLNPFSGIPGYEAAYLEIMGYQTQALYRQDGITVALLTVGLTVPASRRVRCEACPGARRSRRTGAVARPAAPPQGSALPRPSRRAPGRRPPGRAATGSRARGQVGAHRARGQVRTASSTGTSRWPGRSAP
jgi:hypothetical protein